MKPPTAPCTVALPPASCCERFPGCSELCASTRHVSPAPNESLLSRLLRSTLTDSRHTPSEQSPLGCLDAHIATTPTTRL
ncbi:hypothetical protein CGCF413_v007907 [Colletotrichum fructicola]|nr:hypothetical protein CGCF413_v007907 [Colletotrichum fructicola]